MVSVLKNTVANERSILSKFIETLNVSENCSLDDVVIVPEFSVPRPSGRVDLAVFNGVISGYEIKSGRDNLDRLNFQIPAFDAFFEVFEIILDRKHLTEARTKVPQRWGIKLYDSELGTFSQVRVPKRRIRLSKDSLLHSLHKNELLTLAKSYDIRPEENKKDALCHVLKRTLTCKQVVDESRALLKARYKLQQSKVLQLAHDVHVNPC